MRRRDFIEALGAASMWPLAAAAQRAEAAGRLPRVGILWSLGDNASSADFAILNKAFGDLGHVGGKNVEFVDLFPEKPDDYPALARKLVDQKVDVIVGANGWAAYWAMNSTLEIPIVGIHGNTLANDGYAKSLSRPGGNVTGITQLTDELAPKRLALLKEAVPTLSRVTLLYDPRSTGGGGINFVPQATVYYAQAAEDLRLAFASRAAANLAEIEHAFLEFRPGGSEAVVIASQQFFAAEHPRIAAVAITRKVPTISVYAQGVRDGLLMSFGPDFSECFRKIAFYVDKILKGAKPADLPIEQPTRLQLAINVKTARAIGLSMPSSLLVSADEVIE